MLYLFAVDLKWKQPTWRKLACLFKIYSASDCFWRERKRKFSSKQKNCHIPNTTKVWTGANGSVM